jgi:hypothetical protein
LIIEVFADQITVWESAGVSGEFTKHAKGVAGKFAVKVTTLQNLVADGSVSRGRSAVEYSTRSHITDDINYNPSIAICEFQGGLPIAFDVDKSPQELDVVARCRVERTQMLPLRKDGLLIWKIGLCAIVGWGANMTWVWNPRSRIGAESSSEI